MSASFKTKQPLSLFQEYLYPSFQNSLSFSLSLLSRMSASLAPRNIDRHGRIDKVGARGNLKLTFWHPFSENPIKYDVYGWGSKKMFCEIGNEKEVPYCINPNNKNDHYIVCIQKYNISLKYWLSQNERTFLRTYERWGAYWPSKQSLQLIRALLKEICFWHA